MLSFQSLGEAAEWLDNNFKGLWPWCTVVVHGDPYESVSQSLHRQYPNNFYLREKKMSTHFEKAIDHFVDKVVAYVDVYNPVLPTMEKLAEQDETEEIPCCSDPTHTLGPCPWSSWNPEEPTEQYRPDFDTRDREG